MFYRHILRSTALVERYKATDKCLHSLLMRYSVHSVLHNNILLSTLYKFVTISQICHQCRSTSQDMIIHLPLVIIF